MSRRRYVSTEISYDRRVDALGKEAGDFAVLTFTWAIPHALDDGSLPADPVELRARVFPYREDKTAEDVAAAIEAMVRLGLLERDGDRLFFPAPSFYRFQTYIRPQNRKKQRGSAKNSAKRRSGERRESAENSASLSLSPSLSHSPSLSPSGGESEETSATRHATSDVSSDLERLLGRALTGPETRGLDELVREHGPDGVRSAFLGRKAQVVSANYPLQYLATVLQGGLRGGRPFRSVGRFLGLEPEPIADKPARIREQEGAE